VAEGIVRILNVLQTDGKIDWRNGIPRIKDVGGEDDLRNLLVVIQKKTEEARAAIPA
jgi:hypothetical protein